MDLLSSFEITFSIDREIRPVPVEGLGGGIEAVEEDTGGSGGLAEAVSRVGGLLPFSSFSLGNSILLATPLSVCFCCSLGVDCDRFAWKGWSTGSEAEILSVFDCLLFL